MPGACSPSRSVLSKIFTCLMSLLNLGVSSGAPVSRPAAFRLDKGEAETTGQGRDEESEIGLHRPAPAPTTEGVSSDSRRMAIRPDFTRSTTP